MAASTHVEELWTEITKAKPDDRGDDIYTPDHPSYYVVAVLNAGDGPDEQILHIENMSWDHDFQVLRLELEAR